MIATRFGLVVRRTIGSSTTTISTPNHHLLRICAVIDYRPALYPTTPHIWTSTRPETIAEIAAQATTVSMLSIVLIIGLAISFFSAVFTLAQKLSHFNPRRSSTRTQDARQRQPSASPKASQSWLRPASKQASLAHVDLETGVSRDYQTFDNSSKVLPSSLMNLHGAQPSTSSRQFSSMSLGPLLCSASSPFDLRVDSSEGSSYVGTSSPPQSLLLDCPSSSTSQDEANSEYKTLHTFGKSGEGQVKVVKQSATGKLFVVKIVRLKRRAAGGYRMSNEASMLTYHLDQHPNIILCHDSDIEKCPASPWKCHMLLEYCSGGDLANFCAHWQVLLATRLQHVPELFLMHFIVSMANALSYLHLGAADRDPIIHRDIKPANLFLRWSSDSNPYGLPDIVLSDFGFAVFEADSVGVCGTPGYLPPESKTVWEMRDLPDVSSETYEEMRNQQWMTSASDMYTFGATLHDLVFLDGFDNRRNSYEAADVTAAFADEGLYLRSPWLLRILNDSLAEDPVVRMSTTELLRVAAGLKDVMARMGEAGVRMPENSWPAPLLFEGGSSVAASQNPKDMMRPGHKSLSLRRPGPNFSIGI
ncbi:hypothetical protein LTR74_001195 [Friedmanniomyces endolithicus]|nr:hypothetical protein LTR74_001195 [Friedmanniomyces endolithicus]